MHEVRETPVSSQSAQPRSRLNLVLALTFFILSLLFLGVALFIFFQPVSPTKRPVSGAPTVVNEGANLPPVRPDFGIPADNRPTITPVPKDNEAAQALLRGDEALAQGRLVDALTQYKFVLEKFPQNAEAKLALYGWARTEFERERYGEALELYRRFSTTYPADALNRYAFYSAGLAAKRLNLWNEAVDAFQKFLPLSGQVLDAYAWFEIGDSYSNAGQPEQANEYYKKVAAAGGQASALLRVTALERLGDFYAPANPAEAANWYGKILEIAKLPDYKASILVKQVKAYNTLGDSTKLAELYRSLVGEYLATPSGFSTLRNLYNVGSPHIDDFQRGYFELQAQNYSTAITTFNRFLGRTDPKAVQQPIPAAFNPDQQNHLARGWFYLANAYDGKGERDRAIAEFRELANQLPQSSSAPESLWQVGRLLERQGKADEAVQAYAALIEKYPTFESAEQAGYNQLQILLSKGPEVAAPYAEIFAKKFAGSRYYSEIFYDLGKAYQAKNDRDGARAAFERAAQAPRTNFYAVRAGERLTNPYDPNQPPRSTEQTHPAVYNPQVFGQEIERDRKELETWLLSWAGTPISGTTTPMPLTAQALQTARNRVLTDAGVKRLLELRHLTSLNQANREAAEAVERYQNNPLELYALALILSENGDFYNSIDAASTLFGLYQRKNPTRTLRQTPFLLQKLLYPLPFQPLVLEQAQRFNFDPLLFVSLMKQESVFRAEVTSSAGARGLAQVMPSTGQGIASALGRSGFQTDDLYLPYTAVEFGSFYLSGRLKDFNGNPYEALAAYNGGAGNVYRWSNNNPPRTNFDRWVENIDFPETRTYVQIIYTNYWLYRQIYAAKGQ